MESKRYFSTLERRVSASTLCILQRFLNVIYFFLQVNSDVLKGYFVTWDTVIKYGKNI